MTNPTRREEPPLLPETRREEVAAVPATRLEGQTTSGRGGMPRPFELPAVLVEQGFTYGERLAGRGAEASLHLVQDAEGRAFVLKVYHNGAPKTEVLQLIQSIGSKHVNPIYAYDNSEAGFWELQAWAREGSLRDLIQREGPQMAPALVVEVVQELGSALAEVHSKGIEHRDLKPENILIAGRQPLDLVLIDFGIASVVEGSMHATSASRTTYYAPPEAFSGIFRKECWDYWSLGIIVVELLTGRHPFAGLSEQVVMHRLMTANPDDFVAGVTDKWWQLLCRGLLRRSPEKRWGSAHVERWLKRDPTLTVASEAAGTVAMGTPSPAFLGERFASPEELAAKLATNWSTAVSYWKSNAGAIKHWVLHDLGRRDIAERFDRIDHENVGAEGELFRAIMALDPTIPPSFRGMQIDMSGLAALVSAAAGSDDAALSRILALEKERVLAAADTPDRPPQFAPLDVAWRAEIEAYSTLARSLSGRVRDSSSLALTPARTAMLLGAVLPGSTVLGALRQLAQSKATKDARECPWFRELGEPSKARAGRLLLLPLVAGAAEAETLDQRRARRKANLRLAWQIAKYGSLPALIIIWVIWYNSPEQVAARQEAARQAEIVRQQQERQRQEETQRRQAAEEARRAQQQRQREQQQRAEQQRRDEERRCKIDYSSGQRVCCSPGSHADTVFVGISSIVVCCANGLSAYADFQGYQNGRAVVRKGCR